MVTGLWRIMLKKNNMSGPGYRNNEDVAHNAHNAKYHDMLRNNEGVTHNAKLALCDPTSFSLALCAATSSW